jgi:hypothetical protein
VLREDTLHDRPSAGTDAIETAGFAFGLVDVARFRSIRSNAGRIGQGAHRARIERRTRSHENTDNGAGYGALWLSADRGRGFAVRIDDRICSRHGIDGGHTARALACAGAKRSGTAPRGAALE